MSAISGTIITGKPTAYSLIKTVVSKNAFSESTFTKYFPAGSMCTCRGMLLVPVTSTAVDVRILFHGRGFNAGTVFCRIKDKYVNVQICECADLMIWRFEDERMCGYANLEI